MAKQCMTVVDTDRLQSVAEVLRCQRHDDGSDEETWRVYRLPHQLNFSRRRPFVHMATPPHRPLTTEQARQEQLGRCPVALGVATDDNACQCHDDGTICEFDVFA